MNTKSNSRWNNGVLRNTMDVTTRISAQCTEEMVKRAHGSISSNEDDAFNDNIDKLDLDRILGPLDTSNLDIILKLDDFYEQPLPKKARTEEAVSDICGISTDIEDQLRAKRASLLEEEKALAEEREEQSDAARAKKFAHEVWIFFQHYEQIESFSVQMISSLGEIFFNLQRHFALAGSDATVTIGYHFTQRSSLDSIRQHGLMCRKERVSNQIRGRRRNGYFGDGIYTANNPHAFTGFGPVGLLVIVLKGKAERVSHRAGVTRPELDSWVGNKKSCQTLSKDDFIPRFTDEIVLKRGTQVLPLIFFPTSMVLDGSRSADANLLWQCHVQVQKIVDDHFHCGIPSVVDRITPPNEQLDPFVKNTLSTKANMLTPTSLLPNMAKISPFALTAANILPPTALPPNITNISSFVLIGANMLPPTSRPPVSLCSPSTSLVFPDSAVKGSRDTTIAKFTASLKHSIAASTLVLMKSDNTKP